METGKKKKRGRGSAYGKGSVTELPSGRWRVRICLPDGRRVGGLCATQAEAEELLRAVDEGKPAGELARALALEVLRGGEVAGEAFHHAVAVLEGGALRMRRAVDLAASVLSAADVHARGVTG